MTSTRTWQYAFMCFTLANTKEPTGIAKSGPSTFYKFNRRSQPWSSSIMPIYRLYVYLVFSPFGRSSAADRFLGLRTRIPPGSCMSVSCECCPMSCRGLCEGPISRPGESYRVCVCVSLSMIKCNNNTLHQQWVGRRGKTKFKIHINNLTKYVSK
jgi:hypothetical protein